MWKIISYVLGNVKEKPVEKDRLGIEREKALYLRFTVLTSSVS